MDGLARGQSKVSPADSSAGGRRMRSFPSQVGEAVGGVIGEEQAVAPLLGDDESCLGDLAPVPVQQEIAVVLQAEA